MGTRIGVTSDIHERKEYLNALNNYVGSKEDTLDALFFSGDHIGPMGTNDPREGTLDKKLKSIQTTRDNTGLEKLAEIAESRDISIEELAQNKESLDSETQELVSIVEGEQEEQQKKTLRAIQETHMDLESIYNEISGFVGTMYSPVGNHDVVYTNQALGLNEEGTTNGLTVKSVFNTNERPRHYTGLPQQLLPPYPLGNDIANEEIAKQIPEEAQEAIKKGIEQQGQNAQDADILLMHKLPGDKYNCPEYRELSPKIRIGGHVHSPKTEIWKTKNDDGSLSYTIRVGTNEYVEASVTEDGSPELFDVYTVS